MCRRVFILLFLVLFGLAVVGYWYMRHIPPAHVFPNPKTISPRQAHAAQTRLEDALRLPGQPANTPAARPAGRAAPAPSHQPVTVRLSEDDINTTLAANAAVRKQMAAHGIQAAELSFTPPNQVTVYSKVLYHGSPVDAQVAGTVSAGDGGLQFTAQTASVDDIPVPVSKVQRSIDAITAQWLPKANSALPITVQHVAIRGKEIDLTGPEK